jgi:hypothetical protein
VLRDLDGVARDPRRGGQGAPGLDHPTPGDLVAVAQPGAWFTYYYWLDDAAAPDFARTVDIHRKPGYDPCELFVDPALRLPQLRVARRLLQKKLGMRYLMDVIRSTPRWSRAATGASRPSRRTVRSSSRRRRWERCGGVPEDGVVAMTSVADRVLALLARA